MKEFREETCSRNADYDPAQYFLGSYTTPAGLLYFDRIRMLTKRDGRCSGELLRMVAGNSSVERFNLTGCHRADGYDLYLAEPGGMRTECLSIAIETGDIGTSYIGMIQPVSALSATAGHPYALENAPALKLDTSALHGWGAFAVDPVAAGDTVLLIRGPFSDVQTPYSFRAGDHRHIEPAGYGHFINHACDPSCRIVYREDARPVLVARRNLPPGTEITFDYTATEGRLAHPFSCHCPAEIHKI